MKREEVRRRRKKLSKINFKNTKNNLKINEMSDLEKRMEFYKKRELQKFKNEYDRENNIIRDYSIILKSDFDVNYEDELNKKKEEEKIGKLQKFKDIAWGLGGAAASFAVNSYIGPWGSFLTSNIIKPAFS